MGAISFYIGASFWPFGRIGISSRRALRQATLRRPGRWQAATALGGLGDAGAIGLRDLNAVSGNRAEEPLFRRAAATASNTFLN